MKLTSLAGGSFLGCTGAIAAGGACAATADGPSKLYYSNSKELGDFSGGSCVYRILDKGERALFNSGGVWSGEWPKSTEKFSNASSGTARGCVEISWDKVTLANGKWKGIIRYEWIFAKAREFVVVNGFYDSTKNEEDTADNQQNADTNAKNNWRAVYVKKNATRNEKKRWTMWHKNKGIEEKILLKPTLLGQNTSWSFDKSKKCTNSDCNGAVKSSEHFEGKWQWKSGSGQSCFKDLSNDFFNVFGFIFDDTKDPKHYLGKLKELIEQEKSGSWQAF